MTCSDIQKIYKRYPLFIALLVFRADDAQIRRAIPMKRVLYLTIALAALVWWTGQHSAVAAHSASEKNAFTPDAIAWGPVPPSLASGAHLTVLEGDPSASSGDYTVRL